MTTTFTPTPTNGAYLFPLGALVVIERTGKVVDGHARAVERVN